MKRRFSINNKATTKNLSFGLDWGSHSVKLIGLRILAAGFELTHCLHIELPAFASPTHIVRMIQNRLQRINFHGAKVTVCLPSGEVKISRPVGSSKSGFLSPIRERLSKRRQRLRLYTSEDYIVKEWVPRTRTLPFCNRAELDCFSLPLMDKAASNREAHLYLSIGFKNSQFVLTAGGEVLDRHTLDFTLTSMLPDWLHRRNAKQELILNHLKSAEIEYVHGQWIWNSLSHFEGMEQVCRHVEERLKMLAEKLRKPVLDFRRTYEAHIKRITVVGGGGLYAWIRNYLSQELDLPVENASMLSGLDKGKVEFDLTKLREMEPIFAQAIALALAGSQAKQRGSLNLKRRTRNISSPQSKIGQRLRQVALAASFLALVAYYFVSLDYSKKLEEVQSRALINNEFRQQLRALENLHRFNLRLSQNEGNRIPQEDYTRISSILRVIREAIPVGTWIVDIQVVPESGLKQGKSRRAIRGSSGHALIIEGRGVAGNYVSEFFSKLFQSGYFSQMTLQRNEARKENSEIISYKLEAAIKEPNEKNSTKG